MLLEKAFAAGDEPIVEWRALTVALLDRIAQHVRGHLGLDAERLPLVKVLEAGTWFAGRVLAAERRPGRRPADRRRERRHRVLSEFVERAPLSSRA